MEEQRLVRIDQELVERESAQPTCGRKVESR
jgi:hypothetical protein